MPQWQKIRLIAFAAVLAVAGIVYAISGGQPHQFLAQLWCGSAKTCQQ
jgi:hypothetical protein